VPAVIGRGLAAAAVAAALAVTAPAPASADPPPAGTTWTEHYVKADGKPTLHVDVLRPEGLPADARTPIVLNIGPYNGHAGQVLPNEDPDGGPQHIYSELFGDGGVIERGYTVVQADLRGFGGSTGCNDFGGPGEQDDVKRLVEWAASQPWSTGKVGLWGKSYDAWTQVMALDSKPEGLAAAVIQAPIIDGYRTLFHNGVHYAAGWYVTPALYQAIDAMPPTRNDTPEYWLGWAQGTNPACYALNFAGATAFLDPDAEFWRERELPGARGSEVPVFWAHGLRDANTKPDNFMPVWATLEGPARAWFGQFAHDRASKVDHIVGRDGFREESLRFLDRYVKGDEAAAVEDDPRTVIQDGDGVWRAERQWPPADAAERGMALRGGAITDTLNNSAQSGTYRTTPGTGVWSFTPPLAHDARIAGVPRIELDVGTLSPRASVVALLYDVDEEEGEARLISRGAHVVKNGDEKLSFELYPQDWFLPKGRRLGLLVASSDADWFLAPPSGQQVTIGGGSLHVPFLRWQRTAFLDGEPAQAQGSERPIRLTQATIDAATVDADLPPAMVPAPEGALDATGPEAYATPPAAPPSR
jgi:uncharacterized protein